LNFPTANIENKSPIKQEFEKKLGALTPPHNHAKHHQHIHPNADGSIPIHTPKNDHPENPHNGPSIAESAHLLTAEKLKAEKKQKYLADLSAKKSADALQKAEEKEEDKSEDGDSNGGKEEGNAADNVKGDTVKGDDDDDDDDEMEVENTNSATSSPAVSISQLEPKAATGKSSATDIATQKKTPVKDKFKFSRGTENYASRPTTSNGERYVNLHVSKDFDGTSYFGRVAKFKFPWWNVTFEDGDKEQWDADEMLVGLNEGLRLRPDGEVKVAKVPKSDPSSAKKKK